MIIVDANAAEDFIYQACSERGIEARRERLDVGDVILRTDELDYVIERKTWPDLMASICDGRWMEQKSRMGAELERPTRYAYLIEGELIDWDRNAKMHVPMWGALMKTQARDDIHVFHAKDKPACVELMLYMHQQLVSNGFVRKEKTTHMPGTNALKRKRDNLTSPRSVLTAMLNVIPGMSFARAEAIVKTYPSIILLQSASVEQLSEIKCGERKLGPALAKRVYDVFVGQ